MKPQNKAAFLFIVSYARKYWRHILIGFLTIFLSVWLQAIVPLIVAHAIDFIRAAKTDGATTLWPAIQLLPHGVTRSTTLILLGLLLISVAVALAATRIVSRILLTNIARHVEYDMLNDYLQHIQKLSQRFFQKNKTGDLMALATNDIPLIRRATGPGITQALNIFVLLFFALYFMFRISVPLTLISLSPLPFCILVVFTQLGKIHQLSTQAQEQFSSLTAKAQENISGMRVIKSYVREQFEIEAFQHENQEYIKRNVAIAKVDAYLEAWLIFFLGIGTVGVLFFGGRFLMQGKTTLGELVALFSYVGMLGWPMIGVGWIITLWQRGLAAAQRVQEVLNEPVTIADGPLTNPAITQIQGEIEFINVSYVYPGTSDKVLDNISLRIKKGSKLAIVGPTGAGKSTFVHLLPRLLEPTAGSILIDGHNIKTIPLRVLRDGIGFVQQESFLFSDSIAGNIAFGVLDAPESAVGEAAEISQLKLDVDQFPAGLDTVIGERGITLSGGQKQRTSISRAVLKNPRILVLDDSLSAVDTYTEDEILTRIRPVMNERTTIIVAHRISTIRDADHIIFLSDGKIVEQGTHNELVKQRGPYCDMFERQQLEENLHNLI
ncbi:ABC transporter ATP-binding protein [candidate division KSB1 bacterium]|nr:ABC transporter ATP-binding protein [candidate division KSB1 bacterium]RQW04373.1 MAG: ABC transporter ATP-binding protein [candidate division KSB1 bacterium]